MTIKIKAPVMWQYPSGQLSKVSLWEGERRVRIVSESDWRKLMKLMRSLEKHEDDGNFWCAELDALKEKKK